MGENYALQNVAEAGGVSSVDGRRGKTMIFLKLKRGIESFIWCKRPTGKTAFRRRDATLRFTVPFTQQAGQNASSLPLSLSLLGDRVHLHDLLDRRNVDNMKAQNDRPRLRPPLPPLLFTQR